MRKELGTRSQEPGVRFIVIASRHQPLVGHIHDDDTPTVVIPGQPKGEPGIHNSLSMDPGFTPLACPGMTNAFSSLEASARNDIAIKRALKQDNQSDP